MIEFVSSKPLSDGAYSAYGPYGSGPPIQNVLKRQLRFLFRLGKAAQACLINHSWLKINRSRTIPLLDFDVICGALPEIATQRLLEQFDHGPEKFRSTVSDQFWQELIGPNTLLSCLKQMNEFCLPPGTVGELLSWKERSYGKVSDKAQNFIQRLQKAAKSRDPASILMTDPDRDLSELLRSEIDGLEDELNNLELLDYMMSKRILVSDIAAPAVEPYSSRAFYAVKSYLDSQRPRTTSNNIHDALNVATLVRLYHSGAKIRENRCVPVLISSTHYLAEFSQPTSWFQTEEDQHFPDLMQDPLYLIISQGLAQYYQVDGVKRLQSIIDDATILQQRISELTGYYTRILEALQRDPEGPPVHLAEWHLLQLKLGFFQREWRHLLRATVQPAVLDHVVYSKLLDDPRFLARINSRNGAEVQAGVALLLRNLEQYRHPIYELWEYLLNHPESIQTRRDDILDTLFTFSSSDRTDLLLKDMVQEPPRSDPESRRADSSEEWRIALHPKNVSYGALIVLDLWQSLPDEGTTAESNVESVRHANVVWPHRASLSDLVAAGIAVLAHCLRLPREEAAVTVTLFSRQNKSVFRGRGDGVLDQLRRFLTDEPVLPRAAGEGKPSARRDPPDYVEVCSNGWKLFADLEPLQEVEMQAGLTAAVSKWSKTAVAGLADFVSRTSESQLSRDVYSDIIERMFVQAQFALADD